MNVIRIIRDEDLGFDSPMAAAYEERAAARAIVFDTDGNIALLNATKKNYHKLPGGGVEEGESIEDALRREVREEIGCEIQNIRKLAIIEEYRNRFSLHQTSYCFLADLAGKKGTPDLQEGEEIEDGFETEWLPLNTAIEALENEPVRRNYEGTFIRLRDLIFLQEVRIM